VRVRGFMKPLNRTKQREKRINHGTTRSTARNRRVIPVKFRMFRVFPWFKGNLSLLAAHEIVLGIESLPNPEKNWKTGFNFEIFVSIFQLPGEFFSYFQIASRNLGSVYGTVNYVA